MDLFRDLRRKFGNLLQYGKGIKIGPPIRRKRLFSETSQSKIEMRDKMQNLICKFQKDGHSPLKFRGISFCQL
jgi:hypothetical protein